MHPNDPEYLEIARNIAVAAGLIGRCNDCRQTWDCGEVESDDSEAVAEAVATIRKGDIDGSDEFEDDDALANALSAAIDDAAHVKGCECL